MSAFRITVVRSDGITHSSEFSGWSAETAMIHFRDQAKGDKRTMSVFVFEQAGDKWHPRQAIHKPEFA